MSASVIRRTESYLAGGAGRSIFRRSWAPPEAERLVLLVHGYAEHSGRYEELGTWLASRGAAVHAYDHQGHGRSSGPRGHVRRFADLLDDLDAVLAAARVEQPGRPTWVVGHSMGGLVVAAWARERQPEVAGVVTSGAALRIPDAPPRLQLAVMRVLQRVTPRLSVARPIRPEALSRDPEVGRAYQADPLVFQTMTVSLGIELFDAAARTLQGPADVRVPMLLLHGGDDPLCAPDGSERFFRGLDAPGSDLRLYPGLRHEIFNEPEREAVFADLHDWLRKREAR